MSDQFIGEIRTVGYNFAPVGWALCNGQTLPISQYSTLFSLLGTTYGGDGRANFKLPDLQGMSPLAPGQGPGLSSIALGQPGGTQTVALSQAQLPAHNHTVGVLSAAGTQDSPKLGALADAREGRVVSKQYGPSGSPAAMNPQMLSTFGGSQPHNNMPPYLVVNFIIALTGIFPPRS